ncbi:unnamed protein product [Effrenium voratum]|nr:unnamed protein product [Effrenium voratum]
MEVLMGAAACRLVMLDNPQDRVPVFLMVTEGLRAPPKSGPSAAPLLAMVAVMGLRATGQLPASAAPGVLETALAEADPSGACAEAVCEAEPAPALEPVGVAVGSEEVAWRREEDAWVLSIPACSADEVTLDTSAEALRVGSRRVAWPRPVSQREADGCVARFSRKRQVLWLGRGKLRETSTGTLRLRRLFRPMKAWTSSHL